MIVYLKKPSLSTVLFRLISADNVMRRRRAPIANLSRFIQERPYAHIKEHDGEMFDDTFGIIFTDSS